MKSMKKEGGFLMLSLMIVLVFASAVMVTWAKHVKQARIQKKASEFSQQLDYLRDQIYTFQSDKIANHVSPWSIQLFPKDLTAMSPDYFPACGVADNKKGLCRLAEQTAWGAPLVYGTKVVGSTPTSRHYVATIAITLPANTATMRSLRLAIMAVIRTKPGMGKYDVTTNSAVWTIPRQADLLPFGQFITKDGNTPLTGDWDVGNQSIYNAKSYSVKTANGTNRVDRGVIARKSVLIKNGQHIVIPTAVFECPIGLTQNVKVAFNGVRSDSGEHYFSVGEIAATSKPQPKGWDINLIYSVKLGKSIKTWTTRNKGLVDVIYLCE